MDSQKRFFYGGMPEADNWKFNEMFVGGSLLPHHNIFTINLINCCNIVYCGIFSLKKSLYFKGALALNPTFK
jgi:hypothetical protein